MSKVLLDTDILSEYFKGQDEIVARHAANYARQHGAFTFTSATVHEIVFGLECKGASVQMEKALSWLNKNEQITPTANDYHQAALIKAKARKQGSILEVPDCLIAAVAVRLGLPLVTGNTEDFQAISEDRGHSGHRKLAQWLRAY
jgi:tRNA(fMet)-specific endonuclease VapC